ncbi:MAG: GNAT family N-acetyltransferase [Tabrizicola sp.]|nr:GNAT family N-acetyltransferase [Tabrizicola sp.]
MNERRRQVVWLRDPVEDDAAVHASYPPEAEIVRMYGGMVEHAPMRSLERSREWVAWLKNHPFGKIVEADGRPVGEVRLHSLAPEDRKARLAIGLFSTEFLGKGIGRIAISMTLDHAFGAMGLHRVDLRVLSFNTRAIRCYMACGFVHEGTEREAALIGGEWHDDWIMGILSREHDRRGAAFEPSASL